MARIGFLACETTVPGADRRRADAFEHDLYVDALAPALAGAGLEMHVIDWEAPMESFDSIDLVILGTSWNYQDKETAFLSRLETLETSGTIVCNPCDLVRWNLDKRYLAELDELGVRGIPTIWLDDATAADVTQALEDFASDGVVVKRQIGAGAEGQVMFRKDALPNADWSSGRPVMIQPFVPAIQQEGEYSFIFIDGEFSHALLKKAAAGDYRIQSLYGGVEVPVQPSSADLAAAKQALDLVPFPTPLYARIDMVRGNEGQLLLMEAEMIEPYLYPEQGPELGKRLAKGIVRRLEARASNPN